MFLGMSGGMLGGQALGAGGGDLWSTLLRDFGRHGKPKEMQPAILIMRFYHCWSEGNRVNRCQLKESADITKTGLKRENEVHWAPWTPLEGK